MQSSHILVVDNILIQEKHIENVNNFVYLGSSIPNVKKDIEIRIALDSHLLFDYENPFGQTNTCY